MNGKPGQLYSVELRLKINVDNLGDLDPLEKRTQIANAVETLVRNLPQVDRQLEAVHGEIRVSSEKELTFRIISL